MTGIDVAQGRVARVRLAERHPIRTEVVVNAGGMYANQIGRLAGVEVPVVPFSHQYLLAAPIRGERPEMPTMRDPDRLVYFRPEAGGSLVWAGTNGTRLRGRSRTARPPTSNTTLLPEDWERFEVLGRGTGVGRADARR